MSLRRELIRLAKEQPRFRKHLLPLLKESSQKVAAEPSFVEYIGKAQKEYLSDLAAALKVLIPVQKGSWDVDIEDASHMIIKTTFGVKGEGDLEAVLRCNFSGRIDKPDFSVEAAVGGFVFENEVKAIVSMSPKVLAKKLLEDAVPVTDPEWEQFLADTKEE